MTDLITRGFYSILPTELSLAAVLRNGQSFRWRHDSATNEWSFGWRDRVILLKQLAHGIEYSAFHQNPQTYELDQAQHTTLAFLERYLALDVSLTDLYHHWSKRDKNFVAKTEGGRFGGIRVLRQDHFETLICFISSTNNNISRIALMVNRLCEHYGAPLQGPKGSKPHYAFPTPDQLAPEDVEQQLRELGFGYRAGYVQKSCQLLLDLAGEHKVTPAQYLESLAGLPYPEAREALRQFVGVGPKVADCIALFGLAMDHVVPVDTHVWQIAVRDYQFKGKEAKGPMNAVVYEKVQTRLQDVWGDKAGWAQQILFTADLRSFVNFNDPLSTPPVTPVKADPLSAPGLVKVETLKPDMVEEGYAVKKEEEFEETATKKEEEVQGNTMAEPIKFRRRSSRASTPSLSPTKKVKVES